MQDRFGHGADRFSTVSPIYLRRFSRRRRRRGWFNFLGQILIFPLSILWLKIITIIDLRFEWFGISFRAIDNFFLYLQN